MDFENFTDRVRGFIQSAQTLALRSGHQQLAPLHLAKCLLDDKEGLAANLISTAGGDAKKALNLTEAELGKLPKVEGPGAGQVHLAAETARIFEQAEQIAEKSGDSFVTADVDTGTVKDDEIQSVKDAEFEAALDAELAKK